MTDKKIGDDKVVNDKKLSKKEKEEVLNKNAIEINPKLDEAVDKTVVLGWGRMNPITVGHEKLVNKIKSVAKQNSATPLVYITHSQDAKKNPLDYDDKIMLAKKAFGSKVLVKSRSKTIMDVMKELEGKFSKVILVVGQDRVKDFETLLSKYNGKVYTFDNIEIVSAGDRDPDAEGVEGMSASKMRVAAASGKFDQFKSGLPRKLKGDAQDIYDLVRGGMKIAEAMESIELDEAMTMQQRRQRSLTMRKYKGKIAAARKRLKNKKASMGKLKERARKAAIKIIRKKVAGKKGEQYASLSPSEKMMIDKKVEKKSGAIEKIAKRLLPSVRKQELSRLASAKNESYDINAELDLFLESQGIDASFDMFLESMDSSLVEPVKKKRFHQMYSKKSGKLLLDKRFKAFRHIKNTETMDEPQRTFEKFEDDSYLLAFIEETTNDILDSIGLEESKCANALLEKAEKSGISIEILSEVYSRGIDCYKDNAHTTPQQWAFSRVNSFITGGKITIEEDADLYEAIDDLEERHPFTALKFKAQSKIRKKDYTHALKTLTDLITRKKKETSGNLRHGVQYYAKQVADGYKNVDGRQLADMFSEEGGAGDKGTTKLSNKYKNDTPGQNVNEAFEAMFEAAQDPDIKDKKGTQPAVYYKGLKSKSTKSKRDAHFKKGAKMDDDNPAAYKPAPGDATAETKPSKHTKKFKQMYGESIQLDEKANEGLKNKAEKSGMPYGILKKVYDRGIAAWRTGHRPGTTPQQWGMARVNSFITKSSGTWGKADADLAKKVRGESVDLDEKLQVSDGVAKWITEFQKSDAPQFAGKSDEDIREIAIASFINAKQSLDEEFEEFAEQIDLQAGINDPGIFKAVFLAGGPGSGKSFIVGKTALTAFGLKLINSDDAFETQLKKIGLDTTPEDIFSPAGQAVRGKAKALTKLKQKLALNGRLGIIVDGTGKDFDKIKKQSDELKRIGYETGMIFVNTDLETALQRNRDRKRTLPDADVEKMWKAVQNNIGKFQAYYGEKFIVVDNSTGADYQANVMNAYRKMGAWIKTPAKTPQSKKWITQQKKERGIKK